MSPGHDAARRTSILSQEPRSLISEEFHDPAGDCVGLRGADLTDRALGGGPEEFDVRSIADGILFGCERLVLIQPLREQSVHEPEDTGLGAEVAR